jgi:hypothetical protein
MGQGSEELLTECEMQAQTITALTATPTVSRAMKREVGALPEATPDWGQPSSTTTTLCVFVTDLTMASRSMGLSVRRLITCITATRTARWIA